MHSLLTKWLANKGIKNPEELDNSPMPDGSPTERETFEQYRSILAKDELTIEDIKEFCSLQVGLIEGKWSDLTIENAKKAELIPYHTVYKTILNAIGSSKIIREALEKQLEQLTK